MDRKFVKVAFLLLVFLIPWNASATSLDDAMSVRDGFALDFSTSLAPYAPFIDTNQLLEIGLFAAPINLGSDLTLELAGWADGNVFGVMEEGGEATTIFSGDATVGASASLQLTDGEYSFFLDPQGAAPYSAIDSRNWDQTAHIVGAKVNTAGVLNISGLHFTLNVGDYFLFMEDLPYGGDQDYNDMVAIVRASEIPEPTTALLLVSGLFGLGLKRRKA